MTHILILLPESLFPLPGIKPKLNWTCKVHSGVLIFFLHVFDFRRRILFCLLSLNSLGQVYGIMINSESKQRAAQGSWCPYLDCCIFSWLRMFVTRKDFSCLLISTPWQRHGISTCLVPETWEEALTGKTVSSCSTATKNPCRRLHEKPT